MKRSNKMLKMIFLPILLILSMAFSQSQAFAAPPVHSIWSNTPLFVVAGGTSYTATSGNVIISWTNDPLSSGDSAFFNGTVYVGPTKYEFRLTSFISSDPYEVVGIFDIYKDNILVASGLPGHAYGLDQPVGNYFKFYDFTQQWHLSAMIDYRLDY